MNLDLRLEGGVTVARILDDRLDAASSDELKSRVAAAIAEAGARVVLDVDEVEFIDSAGLAAILSIVRRVGPQGRFVLLGARPPVLELLRLTRLDRLLTFAASRAAAIDAAQA